MHALLRSSTSSWLTVLPRTTSPPASSNCWAIILLNVQADVRGLRRRLVGTQVLLPQEVRDDAEQDGHLVITAFLHRPLYPFRGQVGVDEVCFPVVHDFKLMFQP